MSIKCWICGEPATRTKSVYEHGMWIEPPISEKRRCYCGKCFKETTQAEAEERKTYIRLKKHEMIRKAIKLLENQDTNMYEYKDAIEVVTDFIEADLDKADSSYEILTAIVLVQNRIHTKMQYKVGKYQVDFLLPDYMAVLEIDGERHKHRKAYDTERDKFIKKQLGTHWEIIRLSTDYLDQNAKAIPKAIENVLEYRETDHIDWRKL